MPASNYGTNSTIAVADDHAARGTHALKITIPTSSTSAERYLQRKNLGPLGNSHYGRLFFRVQSPTTTPFVHWDMILGSGSFSGTNHRIRWGIVGTGLADWRWIYNLEQGDYGNVSTNKSFHPVLDDWMCVEWLWDGTNGQAQFFFQGNEVPDVRVTGGKVSDGRSAGLPPTFSTLNFGLAKYQSTDNPLIFWIDEIALDPKRIGCDR